MKLPEKGWNHIAQTMNGDSEQHLYPKQAQYPLIRNPRAEPRLHPAKKQPPRVELLEVIQRTHHLVLQHLLPDETPLLLLQTNHK